MILSTTILFFLKLCEAKAEDLGLASEKEAWCVDLLTSSDKYLSKVILQEDGKFKLYQAGRKFNIYTYFNNRKVMCLACTCV